MTVYIPTYSAFVANIKLESSREQQVQPRSGLAVLLPRLLGFQMQRFLEPLREARHGCICSALNVYEEQYTHSKGLNQYLSQVILCSYHEYTHISTSETCYRGGRYVQMLSLKAICHCRHFASLFGVHNTLKSPRPKSTRPGLADAMVLHHANLLQFVDYSQGSATCKRAYPVATFRHAAWMSGLCLTDSAASQ